MNKIILFFGFVFVLTIFNCGNDDDSLLNNSFKDGALTSATSQQLEGRWSIFEVEFENQINDVPESFPECGRDFFDFQALGNYREYLFDDNFECTPQVNLLNWTLSGGIITFSNGSVTEQWVITELTSNRLVFKLMFDLDSNGQRETYKAICNRYEPPVEIDTYSGSFYWDYTIENNDKILLRWNDYRGYNAFEKYEIYRLDVDCNAQNAELISTITNKDQNFFIDETPPPFQEICYLFKIYTNEGLLGESDPISVFTDSIEVPSVNLVEPVSINSVVNLNWEQYQGAYFSHYEIEARNYSSGSGSGYQGVTLAEIYDIQTLNTSVELPYFANPVFVINVYNIFGSRSQIFSPGQNQHSTTFIRDEILPIDHIRFTVFSPTESILYYSDFSNLYRYNYNTNTVESSIELNSSSIRFIELFESSYGSEVIVNIGGDLKVYDMNLNFKYDFLIPISNVEHLEVNENDYWLITDRENLYSLSRTDQTLTLISTNNLYNQTFSTSRINVMDIGQNRILCGNYNQSQGLIIGIDANGILTSTQPVNLNATSQWHNDSLFSQNEEYVLNLSDNTMYSTNTYDLITALNQDFFPSGISNDGTLILGTNNTPNSSNNSIHEKNVRTLIYPSLNEQIYNSKGYPIIVYQNHLGQLISLSKGLIGSLESNAPERDIFIEIIE